jgi:hypothetical protein
VVPISARWIDPENRKGSLLPYRRTAERDTLRLLEDALLDHAQVSDTVSQRLLGSAARDIEDLLPHLTEQGAEVAADARRDLAARADADAKAMQDILVAQRDRIERTNNVTPQLHLQFESADEVRQLEANRRHWETRLADIATEIDEEPERIRRTYDVISERLEPVGLAYLWPVTG